MWKKRNSPAPTLAANQTMSGRKLLACGLTVASPTSGRQTHREEVGPSNFIQIIDMVGTSLVSD